jgi:hypothetical protein
MFFGKILVKRQILAAMKVLGKMKILAKIKKGIFFSTLPRSHLLIKIA